MIIGLAGYARSGKDTVAEILVKERGFRRIAFADALKAVLADVNPLMGTNSRLSDRLEWGWEQAKTEPEVRMLLQRLGVACRRHIHPDVWVDAVFHMIETVFDETGHHRWVIPDVRFPNELVAVRNHGGQVWRVERAGTGPVNGHESETAIDGERFDQRIPNDSTLDQLHDVVLELHDCLDPSTAVDLAAVFADDVH